MELSTLKTHVESCTHSRQRFNTVAQKYNQDAVCKVTPTEVEYVLRGGEDTSKWQWSRCTWSDLRAGHVIAFPCSGNQTQSPPFVAGIVTHIK